MSFFALGSIFSLLQRVGIHMKITRLSLDLLRAIQKVGFQTDLYYYNFSYFEKSVSVLIQDEGTLFVLCFHYKVFD